MFTLLRNAQLFSPEDLGVVDLLIVNDQIVRIGPNLEDGPHWMDVKEFDLESHVVIPALVDGHVHVTGGGGEAGLGSRIAPPSAAAYRAGGVGTLVGVLGTDDITRTPQSLVAWTRQLQAQHLSAWCHTGGYHLPPVTLTGSAKSDIVWIDRMIGVGEVAISDHRSSQPTPQALRELAAEAHVAGLMTGKAGILHLHVGDGEAGLEPVRQAMAGSELPARVFNPTHLNRRKALMEEALDLAAQGCTIDFTAFPVDDEDDAYSAAEALSLFLEGGGNPSQVTISSDGGGCLPVFRDDGSVEYFDIGRADAMFETLRELVCSGMALTDALPPLTSNPAKLLRLSTGVVAEGTRADLLVLDNSAASGPALVFGMFAGRWFDSRGNEASPNRFTKDK